jgi:hypothetical protein
MDLREVEIYGPKLALSRLRLALPEGLDGVAGSHPWLFMTDRNDGLLLVVGVSGYIAGFGQWNWGYTFEYATTRQRRLAITRYRAGTRLRRSPDYVQVAPKVGP